MPSNSELPGLQVIETQPAVPGIGQIRKQTPFLIGKFGAGDVLVPTLVGRDSLVRDFGGLLPGSAAFDAMAIFNQGVDAIYVCRVQGDAATISLGTNCGAATARVAGAWANGAGTGAEPIAGVIVTVAAGTVEGTKKLTIVWAYGYADAIKTYIEVYDNLVADDTSPRYIQTYVNARSKLIRISGDPTALPAAGDFLLAAGAEPDYDNGITEVDKVRGRLIVLADTDDADVNEALITAMGIRSGGLRKITADASICALNFPQNTAVADLAALAEVIGDTRTKLLGVWPVIRDSAINDTRPVRPAGYYTGVRAGLNEERSATNKSVLGIVGFELALTRADLTTLLQAGITSIYTWPDDETRGVRILSDEMADGTEAFIRLAWDWQAAVGIASLAWAIGEHQGEADPDPLRTAVVAMFSSYYEALLTQQRIERYTVQCDSFNNLRATIEARELWVHREIKLKQVVNWITDELVVGPESVIAVTA